MRVMDERAEEIFVARDPARASVEVRIGGPEVGPMVFHLTREEARRIAALILFQAARLGRPASPWGASHAAPEADEDLESRTGEPAVS